MSAIHSISSIYLRWILQCLPRIIWWDILMLSSGRRNLSERERSSSCSSAVSSWNTVHQLYNNIINQGFGSGSAGIRFKIKSMNFSQKIFKKVLYISFAFVIWISVKFLSFMSDPKPFLQNVDPRPDSDPY